MSGARGGIFRRSQNLSRADPSTALPPPVSSDQIFRNQEASEVSSYGDLPSASSNGARNTKEEDHFGFLYSMSEKDLH